MNLSYKCYNFAASGGLRTPVGALPQHPTEGLTRPLDPGLFRKPPSPPPPTFASPRSGPEWKLIFPSLLGYILLPSFLACACNLVLVLFTVAYIG